jgi:hypothetical protein
MEALLIVATRGQPDDVGADQRHAGGLPSREPYPGEEAAPALGGIHRGR